jgi:hypothetical protein
VRGALEKKRSFFSQKGEEIWGKKKPLGFAKQRGDGEKARGSSKGKIKAKRDAEKISFSF